MFVGRVGSIKEHSTHLIRLALIRVCVCVCVCVCVRERESAWVCLQLCMCAHMFLIVKKAMPVFASLSFFTLADFIFFVVDFFRLV